MYRTKVMVIYVFGLFMTVIDGTMVNVALPTLANEFGVPTTDMEWVAVGYLLALAAMIPAAGWLGDRSWPGFGVLAEQRIQLIFAAAICCRKWSCCDIPTVANHATASPMRATGLTVCVQVCEQLLCSRQLCLLLLSTFVVPASS